MWAWSGTPREAAGSERCEAHFGRGRVLRLQSSETPRWAARPEQHRARFGHEPTHSQQTGIWLSTQSTGIERPSASSRSAPAVMAFRRFGADNSNVPTKLRYLQNGRVPCRPTRTWFDKRPYHFVATSLRRSDYKESFPG